MTLEQLTSGPVREWFNNSAKRVDESAVKPTAKELSKEFSAWFKANENLINESVEQAKLEALNEGKFDFDDDPEPEVKPRRVVEPEEEPEEEIEPEGEPEEEPDEEIEPEGEPEEDEDGDQGGESAMDELENELGVDFDEISEDPDSKVFVDNSSSPSRNIHKVVDTLYENICEDGRNNLEYSELYHLDTSSAVDMTALFAFTNLPNVDLSTWNTGKVKFMEGMFYKSTFNSPSICRWNVSECGNFKNMFFKSKFTQNIKRWKPGWELDDLGSRTGRKARLPFVGAFEDEEKESRTAKFRAKFKGKDWAAGVKKKEVSENNMKHILDFDTFMMNEGLVDRIKSGAKKLADRFKTIGAKINEYIYAIIDTKGEVQEVTHPITTMNYIASGNVPGVYAATKVKSEYLNDNVKSSLNLMKSDEYYEEIPKDSQEMKNWNELHKMFERFNANVTEVDLVEEDKAEPYERSQMSHEGSGIKGIRDVRSKELKQTIRDLIAIQGKPGYEQPPVLMVWGAPGIGKTSIPNTIIEEFNENSETESKSLIVAQCGDMTVDGFALPMPKEVKLDNIKEWTPDIQKIMSDNKLTPEDWTGISFQKSDDAVKTWLPCYRIMPDQKKTDALKAMANGHVWQKIDKDGNVQVYKTFDGGILMFDEVLRANSQVFSILMQIFETRSYSGNIIGDKWVIVACSNRPTDSKIVASKYGKAEWETAAKTRVRSINFVPDFADWKDWAVKKGHFDANTLAFLTLDRDPKTDEYTNWHNLPVGSANDTHVSYPTPRTWSKLMAEYYNRVKLRGYRSIMEIPYEEFEGLACDYLGTAMGEKYAKYMSRHAGAEGLDIPKLLNNSSYVIPTVDGSILPAHEAVTNITSYIKITYDRHNVTKLTLPMLTNMFNKLKRTYGHGQSNKLKKLYDDIITYLFDLAGEMDEPTEGKLYKNNVLKPFVKMCEDEYGEFENAD